MKAKRDGRGFNRERLLALGLALVTWSCTGYAVDIDPDVANSDTYEEVSVNVDPETAAIGEKLYVENCARCHDQNVPRAPQRFTLEQVAPQTILMAMVDGPMKAVAADLSLEQKTAIAEAITRRKIEDIDLAAAGVSCEAGQSPFDWNAPPVFSHWGFDRNSTHHIPASIAGVSAADLPKLTLDWSFAYPTATRARSQPAVAGGALFVGSQAGLVYAFDLESGCTRWQFQASAEVRNAITLQPWQAGDESAEPMMFFGDMTGNQYALSAVTGELIWRKRMDPHAATQLTAAGELVDGVLYVPTSSLEEGSAISPSYPCCTFRGAIVALDPKTGEEHWRTHFIPPAEALGENESGSTLYGPSGVPVWAGLAFDGDFIYAATGDDYTAPTETSDAVIAVNRHTGEVAWVQQARFGDVWNASCEEVQKVNCPDDSGPDWDYGAGPAVATGEGGRKIVIAGDKGGLVVGLDAATGEVLWQNKVGRGGVVSGINFGIATHAGRVFIPVSDVPDGRKYPEPAKPGLYALDVNTGEYLWKAPSKDDTCNGRPGCYPGYSAAISVTDEYVLAGSNDGMLRAYSVETGDILWQFDTTQAFEAVDGATAQGGAVGGGQAPLIIGNRIILNSGYAFAGKMPGNALLVLRVGDE